MKLSFLLLSAVCAISAIADVDWRIVAADQATTNAVILSGEPNAEAKILWRWDPAKDPGIRSGDARYFAAIDECKVVDFGATLLVNASCRGVAAVDLASGRAIWYAIAEKSGAGPHSLAVLPDGRVAVANSSGCDALNILDVRSAPLDPSRQKCVRAAEVPGAHGVAWDASRQTLFVLGYTNLFEYAYISETMSVREVRRWKYDETIGDAWGHDLVPDAKGGYFITNHSGVWRFEPDTGKFLLVRSDQNVKSFSRDSVKGDLMAIPRERWWTDRLNIRTPEGEQRVIGPFSGAKFYKARWMVADGRQLVWQDEFNGTALDTNRWNRCQKGACDWNRHMSDRPDLVVVSNGWLVMRGVLNTNTNDDPRPYLTGGVQSQNKGLMERGRVEMRVRFEDHQKGAWPALWMMGNKRDDLGRGWPWNGEIDIIERLNDDAKVYQTVHTAWTYTKKRPFPPNGNQGAAPIQNGAWHVYGLEIEPNALVWRIDGKETFRYPRYLEAADPDHWPFFDPYYFLLDMQLGGEWVGAVDRETLPVNMYIDWIRVYE